MRAKLRASAMIMLAMVLLMGVMPASALGAVTMTWERNWGTAGTLPTLANGEFYRPADVAVDKWGNAYVTGGYLGDNRVQMFTANGVFVKKYDNPGSTAGQLSQPRSITTDRWGKVYVTQQGNARIEVFNPLLYNHWGTIETPAAPAADVVGIAVALDGTMYNTRQWVDVQVRDSSGTIIASAITPPTPMGVGVSQDGEIYVAVDRDGSDPDDLIGVYNPDRTLKWVWGGSGTAAGLYNRPWDIGIDAANNVFIVEYDNHRMQVLSQNSDPLAMVGSLGSANQAFSSPAGVGVGFNRTAYVADMFNNRISKWNVTVPSTSVPVAGGNRYETAVEASKKAYPDGCDYVVIATGANWPDALGGAALAGAVDAPLLLTGKDSLPTAVRDEIIRLDAHYAYVLGGESVISNTVITQLQSLTMMTNRLGGDNRYLTANKIAAETVSKLGSSYDGTAFVATGLNFPDALAASPISAANGWPIYLTPTTSLDASVRASMLANGSNHGYILGGTNAVSASVATALEAMSPLPPGAFTRIDGNNRYETAAKIAQAGFDGMGMLWSRPAIAIGTNFPDALAGGVLQGSDYSLLLLTPPTGLDGYTAAKLSANRDSIYEVRFLGGTTVLPQSVRNSAMALLH